MSSTSPSDLLEHLRGFVSPHKQELMESILPNRTRYITPILEEIYQPHNASACLRTCECLGVQDVHIVEKRNRYRPNDEIALGASKWLSLKRYDLATKAIDEVKQQGYRVFATSPEESGFDLETIPLDKPVAVLFGTEEEGLTDAAFAAADDTLRLPMYGFTQSYNISVTLAMTMQSLSARLRREGIAWQLSETQQQEVLTEWMKNSVRAGDQIAQRFLEGSTDS